MITRKNDGLNTSNGRHPRIAILRNEMPDSGDKWWAECSKRNINADIIDLCSIDALEVLKTGHYDICLLRPPGHFETFKSIYDERLYHVVNTLKIPCFPSFFECYIYENKKSLAAFLYLAGVPHPATWVISDYREATRFINSCHYPIVAKTSIGATSSGVSIIRQHREAAKYISLAFNGKGIAKRTGPNKLVGTPKSWLMKALANPQYLKNKLAHYRRMHAETQKGYVIFQEYVKHSFEWRIVRIGESFFAYKKFKVGDMASGAKQLGYDNPSLDLLDWVRRIAEEHRIHTAAFDIFENEGNYLINEIQTIFGHKMDHILEVDGKPGRFLYHNGQWVFEEGMFNSNESYDLRLETALKLYDEGKLSYVAETHKALRSFLLYKYRLIH